MPISRRSLIGSALAATVAGDRIADAARPSLSHSSSNRGHALDVRQFGGIADGAADDTAAIQRAVAAAANAGGGSVYLASGKYRLTAPIIVPQKVPLDLIGDGQSSLLAWNHAGHAIWWKSCSAGRSSVRNLRITAAGDKPPTATAIRCDGGCVDSTFANVWIDAAEDHTASVPVGIFLGDSQAAGASRENPILNVGIEGCYFFDVSGVGLSIGAGGEVRVIGGRFISSGKDGYAPGSIAILLRGGMGGFHLTDSDVSVFEVALQIGGTTAHPAAQNREIFITHATLDSCLTGLMLCDDAYVSVAGCWAASSRQEQILVRPGAGASLVIVGGTIFNGGHNPAGNLAGGPGNGLVMHAGTLLMSGVYLRYNSGKAIDLASNVKYSITGCMFEGNGVASTPPSGPRGLNSGW